MIKVNPELIKDIKKYGAFDVSACFNCGNCTAICPLSTEKYSFPRQMIRSASIGDEKTILSKKEMWLCYYCGECSKTCPREAKPAAFMAAARRYAIAKADLTGITGLLYKYPIFNFIFMSIMAIAFGLFMYANRVEARSTEKIIEIFNIPYHLIHTIGLVVIVLATLTLLSGMFIIALREIDVKYIFEYLKKNKKLLFDLKYIFKLVKNVISTVGQEMFAFKRFRECDEEKKEIPFMLKPWFLHATVAWGFMGLFLSTVIDFLFKDPAIKVALWYPPRFLGIVSGIVLLYGATVIIIKRLNVKEVNYANSTFSDWWFIGNLWFIGLTGFVLTVLVYLPSVNQKTADILFIFHVAPAMQIVVMAAFTKLAHVFYRTQALVVHNLKEQITNFK